MRDLHSHFTLLGPGPQLVNLLRALETKWPIPPGNPNRHSISSSNYPGKLRINLVVGTRWVGFPIREELLADTARTLKAVEIMFDTWLEMEEKNRAASAG